jgi:hypothetical protein
MAITERYVTHDAAGGGDGSSGSPWTMTEARAAAAAGDRVNVKKGTYEFAASWTATKGSVTQPIIWRGYNTAIGDLDNVGRASGNGALIITDFPVINMAAGQFWSMNASDQFSIAQCLDIRTAVSGIGIYAPGRGALINCKLSNTSDNAAAVAVRFGQSTSAVLNCDIVCSGGTSAVTVNAHQIVLHSCRITSAAKGVSWGGNYYAISIVGNVFRTTGNAIDMTGSTTTVYNAFICGNTIYAAGASPIVGPNAAGTGNMVMYCVDNHITDSTGYAFDSAYKATADNPGIFAYNRTRDNTSGAIDGFGDWPLVNHVTTDTGGPETDYVNAASGDFNLISGAPGRGTSSMPYRDIGAVQHADPTFPTPAQIAAAMWDDATSPDRTTTA